MLSGTLLEGKAKKAKQKEKKTKAGEKTEPF